MSSYRHVTKFTQQLAEDVNGLPCVAPEVQDWPYVKYEAIIADPYDMNHDYHILLQYRVTQETCLRILDESKAVSEKELFRIDGMASELLMRLPQTKGKFQCPICATQKDVLETITAPMFVPVSGPRGDEPYAIAFLHSTFTIPHCINPVCKDKAGQKAYSNVLNLPLPTDQHCVMIKKTLKNMRKCFTATCRACGKIEPKDGTKFPCCSQCQGTFYCSKECQRSDWRDHKESCVKFQASGKVLSSSLIADSSGGLCKVDFGEPK